MILDSADLARLRGGSDSIEDYGPYTQRPWIGVPGAAIDLPLATILRSLPCPVVGLGSADGACADAVDAWAVEADLAAIDRTVSGAPLAAMVLVQHLRASEGLPQEAALTAESLAYAAVQQGADFRQWGNTATPEPIAAPSASPLAVERDGGILRLRLDDPSSHNAIGVAMRDALSEMFDLALVDASIEHVHLSARGRCFSIGGEVGEFGVVADPATAHWIRTLRLPAVRASRLSERLAVAIDGAAIGAGIEIAAFARHITASPRSWFQLPELRYGLIPGAGGTVSLPRRIGRQRTAWLALTMRRLPAGQAQCWGLIDALSA